MSTASSMDGRGYAYTLAARANRADSANVAAGDALQWDRTGTEGLDVKRPVTAGLLRDFAGIALGEIINDTQKNAQLAVLGPVRCKYKNTATSAKFTYAKPVNAQDYLTYSAEPTPILLLTTQTDGTAVHGPDEGDDAPVVMLLPNAAASVIKSVQVDITDVGTACSVWAVIPEAATILGADLVLNAALTSANSVITFEIGGTAITSMVLTAAYDGSAAGSVFSAVAPTAANVVAAHGAVEVVNDGAGTGTARGTVTIWYVAS